MATRPGMIHGPDTTVLVAAEVKEHPNHVAARRLLGRLFQQGDQVSLTPWVVGEFVRVVTDVKRFQSPLEMPAAIQRAETWWDAKEAVRTHTTERSISLFAKWMVQHRLGRRRVTDTLLAATWHDSAISSVLTLNGADFSVFGCFDLLTP